MKIGEILPLYHSKLWNDSLLLKSWYLGDGAFLYVLSCYMLLHAFFLKKSSRFVKLRPINVFSAWVINMWVWCFTWIGWVFFTPWQGWINLDLGMNASKKIALQILYWRVSPLNSFDGRKVQKGAELTENWRCAGGSKNGMVKGNKSGNCCALTWPE